MVIEPMVSISLYAEGARRGEIICTGGNAAVALGPLIEEAQARFGTYHAAIAADQVA